ncbi:MAG: tetratricopeptide repeat protein [Acidobacteriota bacterium]|nr:tetratricopeptide repeat protein [Acidobacteriota bacterium]
MADTENQASRLLAIGALSDVSTSECQNGRPQDGEENARRALALALKEYGPKSALYNGIEYTLAACFVELHRPREADPLLAKIDPKPVAVLTGSPLWYCNVLLAQAEAAFQEKRFQKARRLAKASEPGFSDPKQNEYQFRRLKALEASLQAVPGSKE